MQRTNPPTFRPTVWPAEPPETPAVERWRLVPADGVAGAWEPVAAGCTDLPVDFALRELLAPVVTDEDVLAFTEAWGLPGGNGTWHYVQFPPRSLMPVVREMASWGAPGLVHLDAVRFHLAVLRSLTRHLLAHLEQGDLAGVAAIWRDEGAFTPRTADDAWLLWKQLLDRGLSTFAVHVRLVADVDATGRPDPTGLFSAVCLELARYLAEGASVHYCANQRCGKPFTRQRGDAKYGHRSRGVRYCTPLCAKAQSERDRRRRRAEEGGTVVGGRSRNADSEHPGPVEGVRRGRPSRGSQQ